MANRWFTQFISTLHKKPAFIDCNFVVDSTNGNGFGIRSLKGAGVGRVYMNTTAGAPAGTPNLATARSYAILGASAVTNTGSSVLTGNLGISPGTSITGFPPGTFTGAENIANVASANAQASALAAYTALQAETPTTIATALDGQTLTPGVYTAGSGTFTLAASGAGALILNGAGVYVFQTTTTLTTGAGGVPTITLSGGARASDIYWVVGSSATLNSGNAGTFQGNVIAHTSITDTSGGTINGSLIALTGAVTLSAASTINTQTLLVVPGIGNPNPAPGLIYVQFQDNWNYYYWGASGFVSPVSGTPISISTGSSLVVGNAYTIVSVGTTTLAQWHAVGVPIGTYSGNVSQANTLLPTVGTTFIASATSGSGTGVVETSVYSGIDHIEVVGDPNQTISSHAATIVGQTSGAYMVLQCFNQGILTPPKDGAVVGLSFLFSNSLIQVKGD